MVLSELVAILERTRPSHHNCLASAAKFSHNVVVHAFLGLASTSSNFSLPSRSNVPVPLHSDGGAGSSGFTQQKSASCALASLQFRRSMCRWSTALADVTPRALSPEDSEFEAISPLLPNKDVSSERGVDVRMESQVIFDSCWRRFEDKYRLNNVHVPREVVFLNGAPGAGKGANTGHIMATRGLEHVICVSSLLQESEAGSMELINKGDMIPDTLVGDVLLHALLIATCRSPECGVLVDGFPRTALQVDFLKLLNDKLAELHSIWANTVHEQQFPRTSFKVVMLYVDEETSIARQMARAKVASLHNERVKDAGAGGYLEQRATDMSVDKCKKRYQVFKQHYTASLRLKQFFPFHLIDAMGTLEETRQAITNELRYQSSLDLSQATYQAIRHLPISRDLAQYARQQLVSRLDDHCDKHPYLFQKVIDIITAEIMPMLKESGMMGRAQYTCDLRLFNDHPRAAQMLMDVLTDRGFKATYSVSTCYVPIQVDLTNGLIKNRKETKHRWDIFWDIPGVRDTKVLDFETSKLGLPDVGVGHSNSKLNTDPSIRISQSFIPPQQPAPAREAANKNMPAEPWQAIFGS